MGNVCESSGSNPKFHCTVKTGDDEKIYSIEKEGTIGDLKKQIETKQGCKVADQTLTQNDVELDDATLLNDLQIEVHD